MVGETLPGTCTKVKRSASGKISQKTSKHFSPPRIPVSQSCTSATCIRTRLLHALRGRLTPPNWRGHCGAQHLEAQEVDLDEKIGRTGFAHAKACINPVAYPLIVQQEGVFAELFSE